MKKITSSLFAILIAFAAFFTACDDKKEQLIAVLSVALNQTSITMSVGSTITLVPTILPENASNPALTWVSTDTTVATVVAGTVTAIARGTTTIMAISVDGGRIASANVTVIQPPTGVTLNQTAATLDVGSSVTLTATVLPETAANKNVTWSSSNTAVATVNNGVVTAVATGTATITVTTEDGGRTATCAIIVNPATVSVIGITLNQQSATILIGDTLRLIPTITPANATNQNITWTSSNITIATVNSNGVVTAISAGTAMITATTQDGNRTATCAVMVTTSAVTGVTLNQTTASLFAGETVTLVPTILPENATNKNVTWSSNNPAVATVSSSGIVTAVSVGTATITVTTQDGNRTATCVVTVSPVSVTDVALNQTSATIFAGDTLRLNATILPANATNRTVTWSSSNTAVATVLNGRITAVAPGTATITVTTQDGNRTATCEITVVPVPVTDITLNQNTAAVTMGNTLTLTPTVLPVNATNRTVIWTSSNTSIATVNNGVVTPVSNGTVTITATTQDGERTATCEITVITSVASISLNYTTASLITNETLTLVPTILPATATNQNVIWTSSNQSVATVNSNGIVTAVSVGTATITATTQDGNRTATCAITVRTPVTDVTLSQSTGMLTVGNTLTLTPTVLPTNANNRAVTWASSNPAVAIVNSNGVVTAMSTGSATITVTTEEGNFTATCEITVFGIPVTGITLTQTTGWLQPGNSLTLTANVLPANATNRNVTWTSSNTSVAVVGDDGTVMGITFGWTTITATTAEGNFSTTAHIVVGAPVTGITLNQTTATVAMGSTLTLTPTVLPADAGDKTVTWSSSNTAVAIVNNSGVVTPVSNGTATITATTQDGGRTASCAVTVTTSVTGITLDQTTATVAMGNTLTLTPTVLPATATNKTVTWSSSNTSVATVNSSGVVTPVSNGTATITATTQDGEKTATCAVTVTTSVTGITLNQTTATVAMGNTLTLTPTVLPATATNKTVTWSSSNTAVATVNNSGVVSPVSNGTATITATTQDGGRTATCVVTVITSVTGITLDQTTATVAMGSTLTLVPTVLPATATNKTVTWSSSNTAVATVNNSGVVTAISRGTATITATTQDGSHTATCVVTVDWGTISFATTQIWTIPAANGAPETIWSDAVQTSVCSNKTTFNGGSSPNFNIDCRSNPGHKGDLFSWRAISELKDQLCPAPWRVPTQQDFIDLNRALGGTGNNANSVAALANRHLDDWGGSLGGRCGSAGTLDGQDLFAYYWSQTENNSTNGNSLNFTRTSVNPQGSGNSKDTGLTLRCVR